MEFDLSHVVTIRYTNYRGETADRRIVPRMLRFAATEWHPEPQWLLDAFDIDKGSPRSLNESSTFDERVYLRFRPAGTGRESSCHRAKASRLDQAKCCLAARMTASRSHPR